MFYVIVALVFLYIGIRISRRYYSVLNNELRASYNDEVSKAKNAWYKSGYEDGIQYQKKMHEIGNRKNGNLIPH